MRKTTIILVILLLLFPSNFNQWESLFLGLLLVIGNLAYDFLSQLVKKYADQFWEKYLKK